MVLGTDKCILCKTLVLTRQFYYFACGHVFHIDCLFDEVCGCLCSRRCLRSLTYSMQVYPTLPEAMRARVRELQQNMVEDPSKSVRADDLDVLVPSAERIKAEMDDVIAAECVLCGNAMIKTVDAPFIKDHEREALMLQWAV